MGTTALTLDFKQVPGRDHQNVLLEVMKLSGRVVHSQVLPRSCRVGEMEQRVIACASLLPRPRPYHGSWLASGSLCRLFRVPAASRSFWLSTESRSSSSLQRSCRGSHQLPAGPSPQIRSEAALGAAAPLAPPRAGNPFWAVVPLSSKAWAVVPLSTKAKAWAVVPLIVWRVWLSLCLSICFPFQYIYNLI